MSTNPEFLIQQEGLPWGGVPSQTQLQGRCPRTGPGQVEMMNTELGGGLEGASSLPSQVLLTLPFRPTDSGPARGLLPWETEVLHITVSV